MEELTMPYGATVEGDGSWYPKIVGDHPMKKTPVSLGLVPGPCRVSASWDGENNVDVGLTTVEGDKRVANIPAKKQRGGGLALSWSSSEPEQATGYGSTCRARRAKPALSKSTPCPPPSRRGGGVDDSTTGNGLDALAGHQTRHDGGLHTRRDSGRSWAKRHSQRFLATCRGASAGLGFRRGQVDVDLQRVPNPLRDERTTQGAHHPSHHGQAGDGATVRFHGGPVEADTAGRDDLPSPRLATASTGGGTLNDHSPIRYRCPVRGAQTSVVGHWCSRRDCRGQGTKGYLYRNLVARWCPPTRDRLRRKSLVLNLRRGHDAFWRVGTAQKPNGASGTRQTERPTRIHLDGGPLQAETCWSNDFPATRRVVTVGVGA